MWRIPPNIGGHQGDPLPRFTALTARQRRRLYEYMREWGRLLLPVLAPGAHVCVAGHPMLQYLVQGGMAEPGYEVRPALVRMYTSFRGGDRPENAEVEFPSVCVTPRSAYEPWMLFRKPIRERTVAATLRQGKTGGLRRLAGDRPLPEAIRSGRTPPTEEGISSHPCLKPQHFLRILVRSLLPLGHGVIVDPFLGSGSTVAAASAVGYHAVGVEIDADYFASAATAIPKLAALYPGFTGETVDKFSGSLFPAASPTQPSLFG